jgi:hypothetical protein
MSRLGPYEVVDELGRGGMGVVYRAHGPDGREVAVKLLPRSLARHGSLERFQREARLQARLGEADGFVPLLDTGEAPEGLYLVMPLLPGGSLRARIEAGPLSIVDAVALTRTIAAAVGRAHAQGIVHRDLKPENVLFTADEKPLVSDLGLAKHFRHDVSGASLSVALSKTGEMRGTAGYMAPEQIADAAKVGPPADVFALGAILYELLAGTPPFEGGSMLELLAKNESSSYERLAERRKDAPAWLDRLVARALRHDPAQRFADGAELARALDERGGKGLRAPLLAGAIVVVAGAIALGLFFSRGMPAAPTAPASASPPPAPPPRPAQSPATIAPEVLAGVRRLDATSLEQAARGVKNGSASGELDRALADGIVDARRRSWAAVAQGLAAVERSGAPHGDLFRDATLAAISDVPRELLDHDGFPRALELVQLAGRLKLRFARPYDADLLLDEFYRRAIGEPPVVPRDRWFEVLLAFMRLDAELCPPHLDVNSGPLPPPRKPDALEAYLRARIRCQARKGDQEAGREIALVSDRFAESPELGPRMRSTLLASASVLKPDIFEVDARAIALDPESSLRRYEYARHLGKSGRTTEAIAQLREALALWQKQQPPTVVQHEFGANCEENIRLLSRGEPWEDH